MAEYELTEEERAEIERVQTHVVYCPDCRRERGRFGDEGDAAEARYLHHIGSGHSPKVLTGVYDRN